MNLKEQNYSILKSPLFGDLGGNIPQEEINGCGGKGSKIRPPYGVFFKASCNKHDEGYFIGGDKIRRMECDSRFLSAMLEDTMRIDRWYKRIYYQTWAFIYFFAVRLFGKKYFNYKKDIL